MLKPIFLKNVLKLICVILSFSIGMNALYAQQWQNINRRSDFVPIQTPNHSFRGDGTDGMGYINQNNSESMGNVLNGGQMLTSPNAATLTYQIHVLGEVVNPGTVHVMASERLSEAIKRAGDVAEHGSKRRIQIRRNGKVIQTIDLLKFRLYGQLDNNPYLLDNDVIFVPLKDRTIQIVGAVKRPLIYELANEKSVWDVIQLAGGYSAGVAKSEPVRLIRFVDGKQEVIEIKMDSAELKETKIQNGDVVYISNMITKDNKFDYHLSKLPGDNVFYPSYEDRVFVLGGVSQPGAFPFNPHYTLHQYISLSGGYTKMATGNIHVLTQDGKKHKVKSKKKITINPGDTILVGHRRIPPEGWVSLGMSLAGFGLSTTATVLSLTNR